jgi:hypothetical protein
MPTISERLETVTSTLEADKVIQHAIVHGPASGTGSTVTTEGGPVRTFAKVQSDSEIAYGNAATNAATATTQAGIATTQAGIATTQAGIATTKAGEAAASAVTALNAISQAYKGDVAGGSVPATSTAAGDTYRITSAGTSQSKTWAIGDAAIYKGSSGQWTQLTGFYTASNTAFTPTGNIAATTMQGAIAELDTEKVPYTGLHGMKNRLINGKMDRSVRGTSFAAAAGYTLDRWTYVNALITAVATISQQVDAPTGSGLHHSLRFNVTTADASIGTTDVAVINQPIEGHNIRDLVGLPLTFSFWVRSSKTGIHCVSFVNSGSDRSYVAEYTVSVANTWEYKSITIAAGLTSAGTWNYTEGSGLVCRFALAGGTTYQTTANTWATGNFTNTSAQVNCLDTIGNIFAITGVQLEAGLVATPFEHRPYGLEELLCLRYLPVLPISGPLLGLSATTNTGYIPYVFPVAPRTAPTGMSSGGAISATYSNGSGTPISATFTLNVGFPGGVSMAAVVSSGLTAGQVGFLTWSTYPIYFTGCEL